MAWSGILDCLGCYEQSVGSDVETQPRWSVVDGETDLTGSETIKPADSASFAGQSDDASQRAKKWCIGKRPSARMATNGDRRTLEDHRRNLTLNLMPSLLFCLVFTIWPGSDWKARSSGLEDFRNSVHWGRRTSKRRDVFLWCC